MSINCVSWRREFNSNFINFLRIGPAFELHVAYNYQKHFLASKMPEQEQNLRPKATGNILIHTLRNNVCVINDICFCFLIIYVLENVFRHICGLLGHYPPIYKQQYASLSTASEEF
jgi:hypothetical protein